MSREKILERVIQAAGPARATALTRGLGLMGTSSVLITAQRAVLGLSTKHQGAMAGEWRQEREDLQ